MPEQIYQEAKDIINQLAVTVKTSQIHDPNNIAVINAIEKFLAIINPIIKAEGRLTIELIGEFFYMNDNRIRYSLEHILNFDCLIREFRKRGVGSIIIYEPLKIDDVKVFLRALWAAGFSENPFDTMLEKLSGLNRISIDKLKKIKEEPEDYDPRRAVKRTYFNAVSYTKGIITKIKAGEKTGIKRAKRVIENIIDQILEEESLLIGMTAIKEYDEYTYNHSVNVSILSIALGQRIGLNRKSLTDLGLAALFHDIGKVEIPPEILNKPTNFTDEEWEIMKKHPFWGVRALLKLKGFDESALRSVIVAFEHHLHNNLSGYPKLRERLELDLFTRIVTIADQYDAMTSSRIYSRVPLAPDKALSILIERSNDEIDPLLLKFFINMVGVYPVGTLVMLDTKELGLIFETNPNPEFIGRPRVMVVVDSKGNRVKGPTVDLTERHEETGNYKRNIVKTLDPNLYHINLSEFML